MIPTTELIDDIVTLSVILEASILSAPSFGLHRLFLFYTAS